MISKADASNILALLLELNTAGSKMCIPGAISEFTYTLGCVLQLIKGAVPET